MKIHGVFNISNTDDDKFLKHLSKIINTLQSEGQEVEIQYKVNNFNNGQLVYSALILGRKE